MGSELKTFSSVNFVDHSLDKISSSCPRGTNKKRFFLFIKKSLQINNK